MSPRNRILFAAAVVLAGAWGWGERNREPVARAPHAVSPRAPVVAPRGLSARPGGGAMARKIGAEAGVTRRAALELVRALYRREQLARELDLEQRRYGTNYWEPARSGRALPALQREREAMLRELGAEAAQVLADLFPEETAEPLVLTAFFDLAHAGPNLAFLAPQRRAEFEARMLADSDGLRVDSEQLREIAEASLSGDELETWRKWNEPAAAALRGQLIGFNPTEAEFVAILRDQRAPAAGGETRDGATLEAALGPERFAELQKLREPARQTALSDLQRLGLPLEQAEWLAATRARAVADIGEIWRNAALTDAMKRDQVAQLERVYGRTVATRLGLLNASLDGIDPDS